MRLPWGCGGKPPRFHSAKPNFFSRKNLHLMQIRIFNIPIPGGEAMNEEMNVFLRSKKIMQVEDHIVQGGQGAFWCFCIKYLEDGTFSERDKAKVDYRELLDEATFKRFSALREIRKRVAKDDAVPAYAVFTDEELAELAKLTPLTVADMKKIKGIGEKKVEKYGHHFIKSMDHEKSEPPDAPNPRPNPRLLPRPHVAARRGVARFGTRDAPAHAQPANVERRLSRPVASFLQYDDSAPTGAGDRRFHGLRHYMYGGRVGG